MATVRYDKKVTRGAITVELDGLDAVAAAIEDFADEVLTQDLYNVIAASQLDRIRKRFLAETDPNEKPWPKSQAALNRAASGRDGGTLFDTGTLFHSIGVLAIPFKNKRVIQTTVPYAIYHQEGTKRLPQRAFLGFSASDIKRIEQFVDAAILRWAKKHNDKGAF